MLRGAIICPDSDLTVQLDQALVQLGRIAIVRVLDHHPNLVDLIRMLRASAPQVLFVSTEAMGGIEEFVRQVEAHAPGVQIIAISRTQDAEVLLEAMRAGIREFLCAPFERQSLYDAVSKASAAIDERPPAFQSGDLALSFLPSKAGVGASTIALNLAVALSRYADTKIALSDFDLNSGMLRFMLKLGNSHSVTDALEHAIAMDEVLWPQLVTSIGNLDVLHAGKLNPNVRIEPTQIRHLTEFMRRHYKSLCFDLSGNLERYSFEIMHESKRIFLVCTPEVPSLHLAREKYAFLKSLDLGDRVCVLVNRVSKRPVITPEQIEQILGLPVLMTFPNDYHGVGRAVTAGRSVDPKSELGLCFTKLAGALLKKEPHPVAVKAESHNRFIEFFSVPGRVSAHQKQ
jgi:pilus assembly protein CpaE